jgi:hypothetical protein
LPWAGLGGSDRFAVGLAAFAALPAFIARTLPLPGADAQRRGPEMP